LPKGSDYRRFERESIIAKNGLGNTAGKTLLTGPDVIHCAMIPDGMALEQVRRDANTLVEMLHQKTLVMSIFN